MARKKKNTDNIDDLLNASEDSELTNPTEELEVEDSIDINPDPYSNLITAAKELVELYKKSHTINSIEDYRYPGLKSLVVALEQLS